MRGPFCEAEVAPVGIMGSDPTYEIVVRTPDNHELWRATVIVPMPDVDHLENIVVGELGSRGYNAMTRLRREEDGYFVGLFDVSTLRKEA